MGLPEVKLQLWEQKVFEFGITLPIPELPKPTADWGGLGLNLKATCPGAPFCGNPDADANCSIKFMSPFKIPGFSVSLPFPPSIKLPPLKVRFSFPPSVIIPLSCPNYPDKEGHG